VIEPLLELRAALDQAIATLEPLEDVVAVWQAAQAGAQERAEAARGTSVAPNGADAPGEPLRDQEGASGDRAAGACVVCGAALPPPSRKGGRQRRYCGSACRQRAAAKRSRLQVVPGRTGPVAVAGRHRPAEDADLDVLPDAPERPFAMRDPEDPETSATLAAAAALPWEEADSPP
jgi:hypothetical protein